MIYLMKMCKLVLPIFVVFIGLFSFSAAEDETPMTTEMKIAGKALKKLRVTDPDDWAELARLTKESHEAFLRSMSYEADIIKYIKDEDKKKIEKDISIDFENGLSGIKRLPKKAKFGVLDGTPTTALAVS